MKVEGRKSIVTDGLILHLDSENIRSYPLSGNSWYSLVGTQTINLESASKLPEIYFDGIDDGIYSTWPTEYNSNDNTTPRTWEVIASPSASFNKATIFGHRSDLGVSYTTAGGIAIYNGNYMFNWYDNSSYQHLDSGVAATPNEFVHIVATFEADGDDKPRIYVNGVLSAVYSTGSSMNYNTGQFYYCIGYNTAGDGREFFGGEIPIIKYYHNKTLTLSEVQQNFNAQRKRFGIPAIEPYYIFDGSATSYMTSSFDMQPYGLNQTAVVYAKINILESTRATLLGSSDSNVKMYFRYNEYDRLDLQLYENTLITNLQVNWTNDGFYHLFGYTYDGTNITFYVDGVSIGTVVDTDLTTIPWIAAKPMVIGARNTGDILNGEMKRVKFYSRALNGTEMLSLNTDIETVISGLVADFGNTKSATTWTDNVSGSNATNQGGVTFIN